MKVEFTLNGKHRFVDLPHNTTLLDIIRRDFDLKSVHQGCRRGWCGTCTVLLDNHLAATCLVPLFHLKGRNIETVEHFLGQDGFKDIEAGFQKSGFFPCKFCASTKILTAEAIMREWEVPTVAGMATFIPRTWCTCTAPAAFFKAVEKSVEIRHRRSHAGRR